MMGSLRGTLLHKEPGLVLLEVSGVGYEVHVAVGVFDRLPALGAESQLFVTESMAMYGGGVTLYGFPSLEEKEIFLLLREIPGTGAKKAIDYLDKISKSAPDFRRAVLEADHTVLVSLFGFTKKTAEKMIAALKDRIAGLRVSGQEKWNSQSLPPGTSEALAALLSLGYRETEARAALDRVPATVRSSASTAEVVKLTLQQLMTAHG
jgi:Holliday junction DNA helicase RuvA